MTRIYEPNGWNDELCDMCGINTVKPVFIKICVYTGDTESQFPFRELTYCKEHWEQVKAENRIMEIIEEEQDEYL